MSNIHHFKVGHLIDGSGSQIRKNVLLTVQDGVFRDIECLYDNIELEPTLVTDLSLCTILPPLIDCHTHLSMSGTTDQQIRKEQLGADYDTINPRIAEHLQSHLSHGILGVRDGGDHSGHTLRFKNEQLGIKNGPVIIKAAGRAWHQKNRYGAFIGRAPGNKENLADAFTKDYDFIDHVKLINSGLNSLTEFSRETAPQFSLDELKLFSAQVKKKNLNLMVHANGTLPVQYALEAGCHSIEHGFFMGKENIKHMAETETTWVPTVYTMKAFAESRGSHDCEINRSVVKKNLEEQLMQIAFARDCGVTIALGTDAGSCGVFHGESLMEEIKLIIKAGFPLTEAIQCATSNGAKLLGTNKIGLIAKGRPANFLVVSATPALIPAKLSSLEAIYINGKPCKEDFCLGI